MILKNTSPYSDFFKPSKIAIEPFVDLASVKPAVVQITEAQPNVPFDASKLFTSTPAERLTYSITSVTPDTFRSQFLFDAAKGQFQFRARSALNSDYVIKLIATNQYNKSSQAATIQVKEEFLAPPIRNDATPFPTTVSLNELQPTASFALSRFFTDLQGLTLSFQISHPKAATSKAIAYDPQTRTLTLNTENSTQSYEVRITPFNGKTGPTHVLRVVEEFVLPPVLVNAMPASHTLGRHTQTQVTLNLTDYFRDAPQNASLAVTKGIQTLAFAVSAEPSSMQSALQLSGSTLTLRTLSRQQAYTVTVTARNPSGKAVQARFNVQDTQPVDCVMNDWGGWSGCSANCGGGTMSRSRTVRVQPQFGGASCPATTETQSCNTHSCRVDCGFWAEHGACTAGCGHGQRYINYRIYQHPQGGGAACPQSGWYSCFERSCPPPPAPPMPGGSYAWSCNNCSFGNGVLFCSCRRMDGGWQWTSGSGCWSYANINGNLQCG